MQRHSKPEAVGNPAAVLFPGQTMFERLLLFFMLALPLTASFAITEIDGRGLEGRGLAGLERIPCCGFRHVTGIPCPLCGLTRSFVHVAQGRIGRGFMYNLMGPPLFALFAAGALWSLVAVFRAKRDAESRARPDPRIGRSHHGRATIVLAVLFLAGWAAKLALVPKEFW